MPGTYTRLLYHIVFSTKHRANSITVELQPRLYEYVGGTIRGERGIAHEIGGVADHVHLLIQWRTDEALATLLRRLKAGCSRWVHAEFPTQRAFAWQEGYAAFTVSPSQFETVQEYILNQPAHHQRLGFVEELKALLDAHGIEYDERYLAD
ncbi:MAG: IS200/IS605 family transposase [Planctomycetes bacterium]|nr:IS200/IS605 family transposase [Planctomycetota bacterium]